MSTEDRHRYALQEMLEATPPGWTAHAYGPYSAHIQLYTYRRFIPHWIGNYRYRDKLIEITPQVKGDKIDRPDQLRLPTSYQHWVDVDQTLTDLQAFVVLESFWATPHRAMSAVDDWLEQHGYALDD